MHESTLVVQTVQANCLSGFDKTTIFILHGEKVMNENETITPNHSFARFNREGTSQSSQTVT